MSKFPENSKFRISSDFSARIKFLKEDNDCVSNKEFAMLVGVSVPVITKAVNFDIVPTTRILIKIADKLKLSLSYLLGITDENDFFPSPEPTTFYVRIEQLIDEEESSYGKLVSNMRFPRTYIYEWIKENTLPSLDFLFEIADHFKVSVDYLLGRTDYKN